MSVQKEVRKMTFRKEEFQILFHFYRCEETGKQFEDELLSELNYNQLVNQYREKYSLPFPEQIVAIRRKYGVSAAKMSEILGFGTNCYRLYEDGEVPSQSNAKLIQLAEDPFEFKKLVNLCASLDKNDKDKIYKKVDIIIEDQKEDIPEKQFEKLIFGECKPNALTGYKSPDLNKFTEMIVYFAEKMQPWKTKLNKLLFYSDFLMFKKYAFSMSGISYRAIDMGPVPKDFHSIFDFADRNQYVNIDSILFPDNGVGEQFKPFGNRSFQPNLFSKAELAVLDAVAEIFKETSTSEIVDFSHKEKAWLENKDAKSLIDYKYSFDLNFTV